MNFASSPKMVDLNVSNLLTIGTAIVAGAASYGAAMVKIGHLERAVEKEAAENESLRRKMESMEASHNTQHTQVVGLIADLKQDLGNRLTRIETIVAERHGRTETP